MADLMTFPESLDSFLDQYKFIDKEQVYTNGSELIQVFRVKQWAEHIGDVKPVVHGEWLTNKEDGFIEIAPCSVCGEINDIDYNFCPNCGACMRTERYRNISLVGMMEVEE